jgi:hypothetical protein
MASIEHPPAMMADFAAGDRAARIVVAVQFTMTNNVVHLVAGDVDV